MGRGDIAAMNTIIKKVFILLAFSSLVLIVSLILSSFSIVYPGESISVKTAVVRQIEAEPPDKSSFSWARSREQGVFEFLRDHADFNQDVGSWLNIPAPENNLPSSLSQMQSASLLALAIGSLPDTPVIAILEELTDDQLMLPIGRGRRSGMSIAGYAATIEETGLVSLYLSERDVPLCGIYKNDPWRSPLDTGVIRMDKHRPQVSPVSLVAAKQCDDVDILQDAISMASSRGRQRLDYSSSALAPAIVAIVSSDIDIDYDAVLNDAIQSANPTLLLQAVNRGARLEVDHLKAVLENKRDYGAKSACYQIIAKRRPDLVARLQAAGHPGLPIAARQSGRGLGYEDTIIFMLSDGWDHTAKDNDSNETLADTAVRISADIYEQRLLEILARHDPEHVLRSIESAERRGLEITDEVRQIESLAESLLQQSSESDSSEQVDR